MNGEEENWNYLEIVQLIDVKRQLLHLKDHFPMQTSLAEVNSFNKELCNIDLMRLIWRVVSSTLVKNKEYKFNLYLRLCVNLIKTTRELN